MDAYVLHRGPQGFPNGGYVETAWAEWGGQRFDARSRSSAVMELARCLVAAAAPDGPWRSVTAADTPSTFGPSLHRLARLTVEEGERPPRIRPFKERSVETMPAFVGGEGQDGISGSGGYSDTPGAPDRPERPHGDAETGHVPLPVAEAA
jgi:hypothetical protein